jgi:nicotinamidase-related amidase
MILPIPDHFNPEKVAQVWRVPYEERASEARQWAKIHNIAPSSHDQIRICLVAVDVQNTFCIPEFELFVSGRSGMGAVEDNVRLCEFIYQNMDKITEIAPTLDTHTAAQIFHAIFLVDDEGNHPDPMTLVSADDIESGRWKFNPALADSLGIHKEDGRKHLAFYTTELQSRGKYELTIWPYHAMLGGIGYALVSAVEEAIFFHNIARYSSPDFIIKGGNPLSEHYSAVGPEVLEDSYGNEIAERNNKFIQKVNQFDVIIVAGQAKSHCVAWTVSDLLDDILSLDTKLAERIYLLEDCTSPVVVPGIIDFSEQADQAFERFANAGMHLVRSTDPIETWPGLDRSEI